MQALTFNYANLPPADHKPVENAQIWLANAQPAHLSGKRIKSRENLYFPY